MKKQRMQSVVYPLGPAPPLNTNLLGSRADARFCAVPPGVAMETTGVSRAVLGCFPTYND